MKPVFSSIAFLLFAILLGLSAVGYSQELTPYKLSLEQAIELGLENHQRLKISEAEVVAREQQLKVSKSQQLPTVTFSANAFYLGDALILDTDLSKLQSVDMPHFGNTFGIQASQILYKGGVIKKSIEMAELEKQLSELDRTTNEQDIIFLVISNYLDMSKLINQLQVLEQNKALAEQLLANITKLHGEDMVTRNELIRAELHIKTIEQAILTMRNNHAVLSNRLSYALGLPNNVLMIPTDNVEAKSIVQPQTYYTDMALQQHPLMHSAAKTVEIAEKNIGIQKANQFPTLAAFGGYNMQRPLTSSTPVMDLYNNTWQAGISLTYNMDNLFKSKSKINLAKSQAHVTQEALAYTQQNVEIEVNTAYTKYREAEQQVVLMDESKNLANENYEIVKAKYLNQLAITAEMTDAGNAKLLAELEYANALINAQFQYYNLLKSSGTLHK